MEEYISKIACDNKGKRLGKISEIRGKPNRVLRKDRPHAIVQVRLLLEVKDIKIAIELQKVLKIDDDNVWFDITRKEFKQLVKTQKAAQALKAKQAHNKKEEEEKRKARSKMSSRYF
ncbi:MAG: hypothetical protein ACTSQB_01525 [Candidatus Heimdallarchaeota archaeon]